MKLPIRLFLLGIFPFFLTAEPTDSSLPFPYSEANLLPYNPGGWHAHHNPLSELIQKFQVKTVVEVGSWMGLSTVDIAQMLPEEGIVYAVDTWKGSPNEHHAPEILESLYDQFLSNVIHKQLTHKIVPIRMESQQAARVFQEPVDLIYIDATHTYEACYADLQAWYPFVSEKGVICGDDLLWGDAGVEKAVHQFARENQLQFFNSGWFWWLEKP